MKPLVKVTYFVEVISSWCYWAEPAWAELKQRYEDKVEFQWKIAMMPPGSCPASAAQCDWFYQRSGTVMRSPFKLNSGWFEPDLPQYLAPNCVAEAAKDFQGADDRVRLALAHAALREGRKVGRWEVAVETAANAAGLDRAALLKHAQSGEIETRVRGSSAEFDALKIDQRPGFLLEDVIGDRAVFSGLVTVAPLAATLDAMLADAAAYGSFAAHFGGSPPT